MKRRTLNFKQKLIKSKYRKKKIKIIRILKNKVINRKMILISKNIKKIIN
jgi:hypothetical protein